MSNRSGPTKPVRPVLAASVSVDASDHPSSGAESWKKLRSHSVTTGVSKDKDATMKPDGSLRKVSRWFRDFKQKMDPIKVKDRIRYSRPSLVQQSNVNEDDANTFRRNVKTATMGTRRSGRKQLEKRFNSMENLPATEVLRPQNIRKMKSFQFDANEYDLENSTQSDLFTELTQREAESLDGMTEAISMKLIEKGRLFNKILQPLTRDQFKQTQTSDVKLSVLASASLATELTHLINVSIQPENLHLQQQQQQPNPQPTTEIDMTMPDAVTSSSPPTDSEIGLKRPVYIHIDSSSQFVEIVGRLQYQLSMLLVALDENSEKVNLLKMKIASVKSSTVASDDITSLCKLQDSISSTSCQEKTFRNSSLSDSECFLSLINDLGDTTDDNEYRM